MAQAYIDNRLASFKLAYQRYGLEARAIWALKFAFLACLPGEIIQTDSDSNGILTPPFIMMSFIVVTTAGTFGRGFANFLVGLKIVLCSYALTTVCVAADVGHHWLLWGVVYFLGVFGIALFTDYVVTMNSELVFVLAMVHIKLNDYGGREKFMFTTYQARDVLIGVGLGLFSSTFPFRSDEFHAAKRVDERANDLCCEILTLAVSSVTASTSAQRLSRLVRLERLSTDLRALLETLKQHTAFSWYELVNGVYIAELESKITLYESALNRVRSMSTVPKSCQMTITDEVGPDGVHMLETLVVVIERATGVLRAWGGRRKELADNATLDLCVEELNEAWAMIEAHVSHHTLPLHHSPRPSPLGATPPTSSPPLEHLDLASFPMIADSNHLTHSLGYFTFQTSSLLTMMKRYESPELWSRRRKAFEIALWPVRELQASLSILCEIFHWTPLGRQKLIFSAKLAATMTGFVAYMLNRDVGDQYFGPAQMAFASSLDTSKAVGIFGSQLLGCVIGTVFGYLLSTACKTTVDFAIAATCGALVSGFFRSSSDFALAAIYVQFAFFASLRNWASEGAALNSILTNTAAMVIYTASQVLIFPVDPWGDLRREMARVMGEIHDALEATHTTLILNTSFRGSCLDDVTREPLPADRPLLREAFLSIRKQFTLVPGAATQPRFSHRPFPTHSVTQVISAELDVVGILAPLSSSWRQLQQLAFMDGSSCADAIRIVSLRAGEFMAHIRSLMGDATRTEAKMDLSDAIHAYTALEDARRALLDSLSLAFSSSARTVANITPITTETPCLMECVTFCCSVLPSALLKLFHAAVELLDASRDL